MNSRLINVRLDSEHLRKVRKLRDGGIKLSDVVRDAIDERFARLRPARGPEMRSLIEKIFEQYPDPAGLPARDYDVHDRHAARRAIVRKLRAPR